MLAGGARDSSRKEAVRGRERLRGRRSPNDRERHKEKTSRCGALLAGKLCACGRGHVVLVRGGE